MASVALAARRLARATQAPEAIERPDPEQAARHQQHTGDGALHRMLARRTVAVVDRLPVVDRERPGVRRGREVRQLVVADPVDRLGS